MGGQRYDNTTALLGSGCGLGQQFRLNRSSLRMPANEASAIASSCCSGVAMVSPAPLVTTPPYEATVEATRGFWTAESPGLEPAPELPQIAPLDANLWEPISRSGRKSGDPEDRQEWAEERAPQAAGFSSTSSSRHLISLQCNRAGDVAGRSPPPSQAAPPSAAPRLSARRKAPLQPWF